MLGSTVALRGQARPISPPGVRAMPSSDHSELLQYAECDRSAAFRPSASVKPESGDLVRVRTQMDGTQSHGLDQPLDRWPVGFHCGVEHVGGLVEEDRFQ